VAAATACRSAAACAAAVAAARSASALAPAAVYRLRSTSVETSAAGRCVATVPHVRNAGAGARVEAAAAAAVSFCATASALGVASPPCRPSPTLLLPPPWRPGQSFVQPPLLQRQFLPPDDPLQPWPRRR